MSEQPSQEAGQAPAPGAAPVPVFPDVTPQPASQEAPVPAGDDPSSRAAELQAELAKIRAEAVKGATVLLRVLRPHSEFTHGGVTVGSDPTPVPAHAVGPLTEAAQQAGVKIEEAS